MEISTVNLQALRRMINVAWAKGLDWKPPVDISFLFSDFPSDGASNFYPWMDFTSKYREWLGDRVFNNISLQAFEVFNRHFEKSERLPATSIKDDRFSVFVNMLGMHGSAWNQLLYDLVIEVITGNPLCYTGKALFANDHAYGDNTLDNLTTDALSKTSYEAAWTDTANWTFANGVLVRPNWTHLLHGPKLRTTAFNIVEAKFMQDDNGKQVDNPNLGRSKRVEMPDFAGAYDDYWCLVDASQPIHAIARQLRETPNPIMDNDPIHVERTGNFDWMSSGRAAAAPSFPHLIYGGRL